MLSRARPSPFVEGTDRRSHSQCQIIRERFAFREGENLIREKENKVKERGEGENFIENFSRADESFLTLGRLSIFYMH